MKTINLKKYIWRKQEEKVEQMNLDSWTQITNRQSFLTLSSLVEGFK